jgi:phenylacetate-CoA ligase
MLQRMHISELIAHHARNAPGFAARLSAASVLPESIATREDLSRIPVIRKDNLSELQFADPPFGGFLACQPADLKRVFQSPGPTYEPESHQPDYWRWEEALRAAGFQEGDLVLNAFGYHLTPAGAMFEEGLRAVGCTVLPGGVGNREQQVQALAALRITGYVGLPSYLKALFEKAQALDAALKINKAFVSAEPLPPTLRAYLNAQGVQVRQGYGTAECGNLGYECEQEQGWHVPKNVIIQICDLNSGEPLSSGEGGEIVVTLFNPDYALIRFGTGDLSALNRDPCPCGRSSPRLMGWQGRVGDAVKVRGMFLHPRQLQNLMGRFPEITRWQAQITREEHKDYLTLRVALEPHARSERLHDRLAQAARETIKFNPQIEILSAEALSPEAKSIVDMRTWK